MAEEYDIIVAGGGIAGLTAGLTAARLGHATLVLTGDVLGGLLLSIERVDGYPGHSEGIPGYDLCPIVQEQATEAGATFAMTSVEALEAEGEAWRVRSGDGDLLARAVIVATGTSFRPLGVPGEERLFGRGVSRCASCDAPMLRGKPVVVVGGGDSALQEALTLAGHASSVTVVTDCPVLTAQAAYRAAAEANAKIDIRYSATVAEILGETVVSGVSLADGQAIAADGVFVFIGLTPNTGFLNGLLPLDRSGRIAVDSLMRSPVRGILAAGTVRSGTVGRAAASAGDGAAAAVVADRYLVGGVWREF